MNPKHSFARYLAKLRFGLMGLQYYHHFTHRNVFDEDVWLQWVIQLTLQ